MCRVQSETRLRHLSLALSGVISRQLRRDIRCQDHLKFTAKTRVFCVGRPAARPPALLELAGTECEQVTRLERPSSASRHLWLFFFFLFFSVVVVTELKIVVVIHDASLVLVFGIFSVFSAFEF